MVPIHYIHHGFHGFHRPFFHGKMSIIHRALPAEVQDLMVRRKALLCFWCAGLDLWSWLGGFAIRNCHCAIKTLWLVVFNHLEKYESMGRIIPYIYIYIIYIMENEKMFETTNQIQNVEVDMIKNQCRWFQPGHLALTSLTRPWNIKWFAGPPAAQEDGSQPWFPGGAIEQKKPSTPPVRIWSAPPEKYGRRVVWSPLFFPGSCMRVFLLGIIYGITIHSHPWPPTIPGWPRPKEKSVAELCSTLPNLRWTARNAELVGKG